MVLGLTNSIRSAWKGVTWIYTSTALACQRIRTVSIYKTFGYGSISFASTDIRISLQTLRTDTSETSLGIDASSSRATRVRLTFIGIQASRVRISFIASLTHATRWVTWRALCIQPTWISLTWTLALIPIFCICEEWRLADTFSWLDALLISIAVVILCTPNLS